MFIIKGRKYIFEIEYSDFDFAIKAQCKLTKRCSHINNLNTILSEFGIEMGNPRISESTWKITKDEKRDLVDTAKAFLNDTSFLQYIEKQLDLDRELGEWENISRIRY